MNQQSPFGTKNSALSNSTDPFSNTMNMFGGGSQGAQGWDGVNMGQGQSSNPWSLGSMGLEQLGQGVGIAGNLFGLYNQMQGMDMAKKSFNNQANAYNNNAQNQQNFNNGVIDAFGSGQQRMNNTMAQSM